MCVCVCLCHVRIYALLYCDICVHILCIHVYVCMPCRYLYGSTSALWISTTRRQTHAHNVDGYVLGHMLPNIRTHKWRTELCHGPSAYLLLTSFLGSLRMLRRAPSRPRGHVSCWIGRLVTSFDRRHAFCFSRGNRRHFFLLSRRRVSSWSRKACLLLKEKTCAWVIHPLWGDVGAQGI